ncbi:hypothetical protein FRC09_018086 [Ceratobasidium sp. 395]|nr:hypothetical protein FRC09_018086 [Ceratobasidium sp. 395]
MSPIPIIDAFAQFESAQGQLAVAVDTFYDACVALYQAAVRPEDDDADHSWLEKKLAPMVDQLNSFAAVEGKLRRSLGVLNRATNVSRKLVPINLLPVEVLSKVFMYTIPQRDCIDTIDVYPRLSPLIVIPSVCASWRQVALNTPSLWTHIDLFKEDHPSTKNRITLWVQRARHAPVHLHFKSYRFFEDEELVSETKGILTRAESFVFSYSPEGYIRDIFNHYDAGGRSDRLKLIAIGPVAWRNEDFGHFHWSSYVPHTLTTLKLVYTSDRITPTLDELMALLSRTPNLRTLALRDVRLTMNPSSTYPEISLPNLEYFESYPNNSPRPSYSNFTKHLMRSIVPGSRELEVWVDVGSFDDGEHDLELRRFLRRSRVTCWHTGYFKPGDEVRLSQYLDRLPELRFLSLDFNRDPSHDILDALIAPAEGPGYRARCPMLRTLRLSQGDINSQGQAQLKRVVDCHSITRLILGDSVRFVDEFGRRCDDKEILDWLHARVLAVESSGVTWFELSA